MPLAKAEPILHLNIGAGAMSSRPTVKDVATYADVSTATVSRVINGFGGVSEDLKLRVLSAVSSLGYSPNAYAAQLGRNGGIRRTRHMRDAQRGSHRGSHVKGLHRDLKAVERDNEQLRVLADDLQRRIARLEAWMQQTQGLLKNMP